MEQNICRFIPFHKDTHSIHTIHFVLETEPQSSDRLRSESVYKMHLVRAGEGFLHTAGRIEPLKAGDLFFTFPAVPFAIESTGDFSYMYISFVGQRGNKIMESLKVNHNRFLFHDMHEVCDFWEKGLKDSGEMSDLVSESVLLYTFARLGNRILEKEQHQKPNQTIDKIKKYVDDHFTDLDFSIDSMSRELSYNKKYMSHVFKKHFGLGITEYVNTVRIQNACTLIEQGFTSVNDIADRCGFADAQYFSKVFKSKMTTTPTQYIKTVKADRT